METHKITQFYVIGGMPIAFTENGEILYWFELRAGFEDKESVLQKAMQIGKLDFANKIIAEAEKLIN